MIFGMVKDIVFDKALDLAFSELRGTFSAEQALQNDITETKDSYATILLILAFGLIPASIVLSNVLFFGYDVGFLYIFGANLLIPYGIYKAIKHKVNTLYNRVKFLLTLKDNLLKISTDSKAKIETFINKFDKSNKSN